MQPLNKCSSKILVIVLYVCTAVYNRWNFFILPGLPSFPEVTSYLRKLDNVKLYDLAGELGLNVTDLRNRVSVDSLPRVLCERWLREDDDVQTRSGDPSWSSLAKAMCRIGANGLARKIEKEKINLVLF